MTKNDWLRFVVHFPIGVLGAILTRWHAPIGLMLMVYFLSYEVMNDWRKVDSSYKDVLGGAFGFGLTALVLFLISVILD